MQTENHQRPEKTRKSLGHKSLIAIGIFVCTLFPMALWSSQPQYQGPSGLGMGMMMGFGCLLFWIPLIITATVLSIKSILKNDESAYGAVTLVVVLIIVSWIFTNTS